MADSTLKQLLSIRRKNRFDEPYEGAELFFANFHLIVYLMIILGVISASLVVIPAGHVGVIVTSPSGPDTEELQPGWNFNPKYMVSTIEIIRFNTQQVSFIAGDDQGDIAGSINVRSSDSLTVTMDMVVLYSIPKDKVAELRIDVGDIEDTIILQYARSVPRNVASHYNAVFLAGEGRDLVEDEITKNLTAQLRPYNITVVDVALREVRLPFDVDAAIEDKKAEEQKKLQAEFERERILIQADAERQRDILESEGNRNATIIRAEGERQKAILAAEGDRNATIIRAEGNQEAIRLVKEELSLGEAMSTATEALIAEIQASNMTVEEKLSAINNATAIQEKALQSYLGWLYIQALMSGDSNVQYVLVPTGTDGTPVILDLDQ